MSIIDKLFEKDCWDAFYDYKISHGNINEAEAADLRSYIDSKEYLPVAEKIRSKEEFSAAEKSLISKSKAGRKRIVYTFRREENYILKLISYLLRDYDYLFSPNLYSFRKDSGVKKATRDILKIKNLDRCYVYKADISDYFNSVEVDILLPELESVLISDRELFDFIRSILKNPCVQYCGELVEEKKGIMAGVPLSAFLANFYLRELDAYFYEKGIPYVRYSDDILVFAYSEEELKESIGKIKSFLNSRRLKINPEKETVTPPGEKWEFLGFSYYRGTIDISDISFEKLKSKMRRKARALCRWSGKKNVPGDVAARVFVKKFNAKLYDNPVYNELTWTRWFFPVINTSETLKAIDAYMQDCIRYIATGKRTKVRYNFRYEEIKDLGYRSLVNEYYKFKAADDEKNEQK
ncbi:MAG: group II intron reverse transcriptase domain-containing protein [Clostridia bacterium]|nr:group II intron reverse transcriptase domain-containing protein [Clostridia bacterium]